MSDEKYGEENERLKREVEMQKKLLEQFRVLAQSKKSEGEEERGEVFAIMNALKLAKREKKELIARKKELFKKNGEYHFQLKRYGEEIKKRFKIIKELECASKNQKSQIEKLKGDIKRTKDSSEVEIQQLTKKLFQQSISDKQTIEDLKKLVKSKTEECEYLKKGKSGNDESARRLGNENAQLKSDNTKLSMALEHKQKMNDQELRNLTQSNISQIKRLNENLSKKEVELEELQELSKSLKNENNNLKEESNFITEENKTLRESIKKERGNLQEEFKKKNAEISQLKKEVEKKDEFRKMMRENHDKTVKDYNLKIEELEKCIVDVQRAMVRLENERDSLLKGAWKEVTM